MISQKIRKSKTDPEPLPGEAAGLEGRAEARNLVGIYAAVSGESVDQVLARFGGPGLGAFKPALAEMLVEKLGPADRQRVVEGKSVSVCVYLGGIRSITKKKNN